MLCVIAKLDEAATKKLTEIQEGAFKEGVAFKRVYGHVTVAAYTGNEEGQFIREVKKMLEGISAFDITYENIEVLDETSIIAAVPGRSKELEYLHRVIAEKYDDSLDRWTKTDCWYPHTTLLYDPKADLHSICLKMKQSYVPFMANVYRIEFSRVLEKGYEIIDYVDLVDGRKNMKQVFESERISFTEISGQLVKDYLIMVNDVENVGRFFSGGQPYTEEQEISWVQKTLEEKRPVFSMIEKETGEFIGNIELMDVNDGTGELGIAITAKKQNQGFGTEAVTALTRYAMDQMGLERVFLRTNTDNDRAYHVYQKCGFREYKRTDEHIYMEITR